MALVPGLHGFDREIEALIRVAGKAAGGAGQIVVLTGPAGAGKSALIDGVVERITNDFAYRSARGECVTVAGGGEPLTPFKEIVRTLQGGKSRTEHISGNRAEFLRNIAPAWVNVIPVVGGAIAAILETGREAARIRQEFTTPSERHHQFVRVISQEAADTPLALVIDDAQWADSATLDLIYYLAKRLERLPVLLVLAYRSDASNAACPSTRLGEVIQELRCRSQVTEVHIGPLDPQATQSLITDLQRTAVSESVAQSIHSWTGGNPLFIRSLLEVFRVEGVQINKANVESLEKQFDALSMPGQLEAIVDRHIASLTSELRQLAELASVEGSEFSERIALRVALESFSWSVDDGYHFLDELERIHGLIQDAGEWEEFGTRFSFRNDLTRRAVYKNISRALRKRYHRKVADQLEELLPFLPDLVAPRLALHYAACAVPTKNLKYSLMAGQAAFEVAAIPEAIEHLTRAQEAFSSIRAPTPDDRKCQALSLSYLGLCYAQRVGDASQGLKYHLQARDVHRSIDGQEWWEAKSLQMAGVSHYMLGHTGVALDCYREALSLDIVKSDDVLQGNIYRDIGKTHFKNGNFEEALAAHRKSEELLRSVSDSGEYADTLRGLGDIMISQGRLAEGKEMLRRTSEIIATGNGHELRKVMTARSLANAHRADGRIDLAVIEIERGIKVAEDFGFYHQLCHLWRDATLCYAAVGDRVEAHRSLDALFVNARLCGPYEVERAEEVRMEVLACLDNMG